MTERDEQELREFVQLKHHSHGLKNQQPWLIFFVSGPDVMRLAAHPTNLF
jgi:hypothetical protein